MHTHTYKWPFGICTAVFILTNFISILILSIINPHNDWQGLGVQSVIKKQRKAYRPTLRSNG